jgi:hypothetical protein
MKGKEEEEKESEFFSSVLEKPDEKAKAGKKLSLSLSHRPRRSPTPSATPPVPERSSVQSRASGVRRGPSGSGRSRPVLKLLFLSVEGFFFSEKRNQEKKKKNFFLTCPQIKQIQRSCVAEQVEQRD